MKILVWSLVALLIVAHQDFWFWDDDRLVLGFLPIGLFYHVCHSIAAGIVWWMACTFAWPKNLEAMEESQSSLSAGKGHSHE